jgi:putative salt-induced outer membrane protein YdiY
MAKNCALCALLLCYNPALQAKEAPSPVTNSISFGAAINTGNSPTKEITGEYKRENELSYPKDAWAYDFTLGGQWSTAQGVKNEENVYSSVEGRYLFSEKNYFFNKLSFLYDAFATYDLTFNGIVGLGRVLVQTPTQKLTVEAGPGGTYQRVAGSREKEDSVLGHGDLSYRYLFETGAKFTQSASIDYSSFNTHYRAESAITSKLVKNIDLKISFTVNHDTIIPATTTNTKKTDTATTASILYNF